MADEYHFGSLHFFPLDVNNPNIFGFSEFLAALALMVLAWNLTDVRYRFRIRIAPLPLRQVTFYVIVAVGVLTLLTDLWYAEQWLVPQGHLVSPSQWQAFLGGIFLLTFLSWAWFAFIRPPIYSKWNAARYAETIYGFIVQGDPSVLPVIANELTRSTTALIKLAPEKDGPYHRNAQRNKPKHTYLQETAINFANDILLMIADKRFCRTIVESSPHTAWTIFYNILETKKYGVNIDVFARNIFNAAIMNKDSFLFHESHGYDSGLIGFQKPISNAMFSCHKMVETIGTILDPDISNMRKWDADQWEAYSRATLMTFKDYVDKDFWNHSFVLHNAKGHIQHAASELYKINGTSQTWDADVLSRLRVSVKFIQNAVEILEAKGVPDHLSLRVSKQHPTRETIYDHIANMIFEVICEAAEVRSPIDLCWHIQNNSVWMNFFSSLSPKGDAAKVVKHKVRRLIYDEIAKMKTFPNYRGARILGFCLNVMGFDMGNGDIFRDGKALRKAVLNWTEKNYSWLYLHNSSVAEACLVDGITYDPAALKLIKTRSVDALRNKPETIDFPVDPPPQ